MSKLKKEITVRVDQSVDTTIFIDHIDVLDYIRESGASDKELKEIIKLAGKNLSEPDDLPVFNVESLHDEMKMKLLFKAYKKYSLTELELRLNN